MLKKSDLRKGQDATVTEIYEEDGLLVVVPMGGGKTAAYLTAVDELQRAGEIRCSLVLAPKKVAQLVWPKEKDEWEHLQHMRVEWVRGSPEQRRRMLLEREADVYVLGIDNTQWLCELLATLPDDHYLFDMLGIDEISKLKNPRGKRGKALQKLAKRFKQIIGMTGTPRPNGYEDLFRPLSIITRERLWGRSYDKWHRANFMPIDYQGYRWTILPHRREQIIKDIASVSVTISEMPDVPPYQPVFRWLEMPKAAMKNYREMERDLIAKHWDGEKERWIDAANAAVARGKMAQLTQGFLYEGEYDEEGKLLGILETHHVHSEKTDYWAEMMEAMEENSLTAYEYQEDLRRLLELYPDTPYLGAGTTDRQTAEFERAWQAGELERGFLHPASAGHGLNLQKGGNQLVLYCMPWSAENYDQLLKRMTRPGQTRPTFGHHLLMRGTIDEVKYNRVVGKMSEQDAFRQYIRKVDQ